MDKVICKICGKPIVEDMDGNMNCGRADCGKEPKKKVEKPKKVK